MKKIGLTTTVPIEVLIAAGYEPVDLNNIFITSKDYGKYIDIAEQAGFPKSLCAWIKGIYGVCIEEGIQEVVGVVGGDCSNTKALVEVLNMKGIKIHPFSFPHKRTLEDVKREITVFMKQFNVSLEAAENVRRSLAPIRTLAKEIDRLTFEENKASGFENHLYQVSLSDCNGDRLAFKEELQNAIQTIKKREPLKQKLRLAYIGVPPMTADIYAFAEQHHAAFVYNEVQREFAFPRADQAIDLFRQYYDYTYPYDIHFRMEEIKKQIQLREIDAVIHYTQAFCYRAVEDIALKEQLGVPMLHIEGDKLNTLDARTKLRLEAFLDMLLDLKEGRA